VDERKPTYEELSEKVERNNKIKYLMWSFLAMGMILVGAGILSFGKPGDIFAGAAIIALANMLFVCVIAMDLRDEIRRKA
jgi:hypothetical protein